MKNSITIIAVLLLAISSLTCGISSESSVINQDKLKRIIVWNVDLKYHKGGTIESGTETTNINQGNTKYDLELLDNIIYTLKSKFGMKISKDNYQGSILIVTERYKVDPGYKYITAYYEDEKKDPLARLTINNGGTKLDIENDKDFADKCAEKIYYQILGIEQ